MRFAAFVGGILATLIIGAMCAEMARAAEPGRGWSGLGIMQVSDDIARSLNVKPNHGALVAQIADNSPARLAGIEPGDIIVKFNGRDIENYKDLPLEVRNTQVGREVDIVFVRRGLEQTRKMIVGRLSDP